MGKSTTPRNLIGIGCVAVHGCTHFHHHSPSTASEAFGERSSCRPNTVCTLTEAEGARTGKSTGKSHTLTQFHDEHRCWCHHTPGIDVVRDRACRCHYLHTRDSESASGHVRSPVFEHVPAGVFRKRDNVSCDRAGKVELYCLHIPDKSIECESARKPLIQRIPCTGT